jgi:hypothetical protein
MILAEMRCDFPSDFNVDNGLLVVRPIAPDRAAVVRAGLLVGTTKAASS